MGLSAKIVLDDGTEFHGKAYGARGQISGPVILTTSGYEKALFDPANAGAILLLATPHIGNTGLSLERRADRIAARGLIARDPMPRVSAGAVSELEEKLTGNGVVGICEVDTRALARRARAGNLSATIISEEA